MDMNLLYLLLAIVLLEDVNCQLTNTTCDDIDTQACVLIQAKNPHLCQDPLISSSACPRFCGQCRLKCYHCDNFVSRSTECNVTKECQLGEQCLLLLSTRIDGHQQLKMNCATADVCSGQALLGFGRRRIDQRSLSVNIQCCNTDGCNNPSISG